MKITEHARSEHLFKEGQALLPGGVSSPIRSFREVDSAPVFLAHGEGARVVDVDGNCYLDFMCALGPLILGHCHPAVVAAMSAQLLHGIVYGAPTELEYRLAGEILRSSPELERIRFVCSGTEAVMTAVRVARVATGRPYLLRFGGSYHGHSDAIMGSREGTVLFSAYNDLDGVARIITRHGGALAAILVEPYACNMGLVKPDPVFLPGLRQLCDDSGALLIFDEVITGFRLRYGTVGTDLSVEPDLVTFGKIIGGGTAIGAYGGRERYMALVDKEGGVFQGGTFAGNPLSMAAGLATLEECSAPRFYDDLDALGQCLEHAVRTSIAAAGLAYGFDRQGSICSFVLSPGLSRLHDEADANRQDARLYGRFHSAMLQRGYLLPPSVEEPFFLSSAHTPADVLAFAASATEALVAVEEHASPSTT